MEHTLSYLISVVIIVARYFLLAGLPFLIFYIFFPNFFSKSKLQTRMAQKKDFLREVGHSLKTSLVLAGIGIVLVKTPLVAYTQVYHNLADFAWWWLPMSVVLALLVHDTYFYWMHRTAHHPKLYQKIHVVHHQSINPSPWASYSFQLSEAFLEGLIAPIILLLIPMHPIALLAFASTSFIFNVYGHLGYEITPRWFRHSPLFEIINTSTHHNIHHSKFKGNYGLYLRVWDRLMGTEHPDYVRAYDAVQQQRFGAYKKPTRSWRKATLVLIGAAVGLTLVVLRSSGL
jgi:sterol desaturase/sphingolipid hydroxylase (fatty acid hydroxylase superfamily)